MGGMSGSMALDVKPTRPGPDLPGEDDLFSSLRPPKRGHRALLGANVSLVVHVVIGALLLLGPLYWPQPSPEQPNNLSILVYNPPPPPPLPLPKGNPAVKEVKVPQPVSHELEPIKPTTFTAPQDVIQPELLKDPGVSDLDQAGILDGSDSGVPEGMEGGVPEGQVGGVLGGVPGGVIGGTGDVVFDYDQAPRLIKQTKPQYPQEAFVKRIEGTVLLEIVIDASGRVVSTRILKSVPLLDAAAVETVRQWIFAPAIKRGRPVATTAHAPVNFRIY
jgi:protein TonB